MVSLKTIIRDLEGKENILCFFIFSIFDFYIDISSSLVG